MALSEYQAQQEAQVHKAQTEIFKKQPRNQAQICDGVQTNCMAREWRCKWSEDDNKKSLIQCQAVLEDIVVPAMRNYHGMLSIQRVVCGGNKDFKVIVKMGLDAFDDWASLNYQPEEDVVAALMDIDGVSKIETQTYTIMPIFGPGK
mmetsp:Transcript_63940/g.187569  ORF Transcript_63940/g.187569 Transcript_63940/m.187569 type:complete len:147 (+) Transcript_63940:57-497(+)